MAWTVARHALLPTVLPAVVASVVLVTMELRAQAPAPASLDSLVWRVAVSALAVLQTHALGTALAWMGLWELAHVSARPAGRARPATPAHLATTVPPVQHALVGPHCRAMAKASAGTAYRAMAHASVIGAGVVTRVKMSAQAVTCPLALSRAHVLQMANPVCARRPSLGPTAQSSALVWWCLTSGARCPSGVAVVGSSQTTLLVAAAAPTTTRSLPGTRSLICG